MTSDTPPLEEASGLVSSEFNVYGVRQNIDALQFEIDDKDFKQKFVALSRKLEARHLVARLERFEGKLFILVGKFYPSTSRRPWIPRVLFAVTVAMVMIDGYYRTQAANSIVNIGDPVWIAVLYTASLMGILGIHELGHMVAARYHKLKTSWPYFIPGIPVFGIPTFGAVIQSRAFMVNRDILFDVGASGPIAGLIIAIVVSIFGAYLSPVIPESLAKEHFAHTDLIGMHESIMMKAVLLLTGKVSEGTQVFMSPVMFAAWLGFLITFLNLLPAWQLDGGHIARAMFGNKLHRILTYVSVVILFLLGYWFMALYVLSFSSRTPGIRPLDDISPLSRNRKVMFVALIGIAVVLAPLPFLTNLF